MVIGTDLSVPSAQLPLSYFIKLWLTKGFYWKMEAFFCSQVTKYSLSIDLTELTHQFCSVLFNTKILRETKPFRDLHDKKVRLS